MKLPILSLLILLPLFGAFIVFILHYLKRSTCAQQLTAIVFSIINFFLSLHLLLRFDTLDIALQFTEQYQWIANLDATCFLGVDGISIYFIVLTALLIPICIVASASSIKKKIAQYLICFLVLESLIVGVFTANDLLMFYVLFESVLIPMFFIIGIWGGSDRIYAAFKFFLYTLFGSLLMLVAVLYIYFKTGTSNMVEIAAILPTYDLEVQKWLWLGFFFSFAIKVPMWPLHTWLPDAHVQAPTSGSVILAGILLKMGGYGFLRFSIPMLPDASFYFADYVIVLSIIAVVYTSMIALVQEDMKKLIAYSSIAHMGYVTAGIFSFGHQGINGAIYQMISHGLVSSALFLCVGVLYDRMHTKDISFYGGLAEKMPRFAFAFMVFMLASVGLPSTSGFIGEFLVLLSVFKASAIYGVLISSGIVLGAAYMLLLYGKLMFGELKVTVSGIKDISMSERGILYFMAVLIILLGVYPSLITRYTDKSVDHLTRTTLHFKHTRL